MPFRNADDIVGVTRKKQLYWYAGSVLMAAEPSRGRVRKWADSDYRAKAKRVAKRRKRKGYR